MSFISNAAVTLESKVSFDFTSVSVSKHVVSIVTFDFIQGLGYTSVLSFIITQNATSRAHAKQTNFGGRDLPSQTQHLGTFDSRSKGQSLLQCLQPPSCDALQKKKTKKKRSHKAPEALQLRERFLGTPFGFANLRI